MTRVDVGADVPDLVRRLTNPRPDVVFNALHGHGGEDGRIQGLLDLLELPYTHSGLRASALAMDKPAAKTMFRAAGLRCAEGLVAPIETVAAGDVMARPYVVKPPAEGSTFGVRIVQPGDNGPAIDLASWRFGPDALVERYIPGRELTVAVMDDGVEVKALGVTEIRPHGGFYSYEAKYTAGKAVHDCPALIPDEVYGEAMATAEAAHKALGCRGVSRADFRYDDTLDGDGLLYLLEVNTQPGMTPLSLVPELAAMRGISFGALVTFMVERARWG